MQSLHTPITHKSQISAGLNWILTSGKGVLKRLKEVKTKFCFVVTEIEDVLAGCLVTLLVTTLVRLR